MKDKPLILISNDDGIESPGLHAAAEALLPIADLLIAAPREQQSAAGRSMRAAEDAVFESRTLNIAGKTVEGFCLNASPATTVRHALQCLCINRKPDMIVSGINFGENIGTNVSASGTVGAAIQSAVWGYKSLAISLEVPPRLHYEHGEVDWSAAVSILRRAVEKFLPREWPEDVHVLKVDIPDTATAETPWRATKLSREPGWWGFVPDAAPASAAGTTIGKRGPRPGEQWDLADDLAALHHHKEVAVTALSLDMTSRCSLDTIAGLFD